MATPSFQIDDTKLEELDQVINIKKARGELDSDKSRSDVLRQLVEEYVEGNETSWTTSKATPAAD
jgi:metal-responsive CopG/Arc/MetJ family transcriptional regulator